MDEAFLSDIRCFKFLDEHGTKKQNNKVTQQNITTLFYSLTNKYRQHAYADLLKFHNQRETNKETNKHTKTGRKSAKKPNGLLFPERHLKPNFKNCSLNRFERWEKGLHISYM